MKLLQFLKNKKSLGVLSALALVLGALPTSASAAGGGGQTYTVDFSGGGFQFTLSDIMTTAWNFISQFNLYVVLILALIIVPTLVGFVIWLMSKVPRFRKSKA